MLTWIALFLCIKLRFLAPVAAGSRIRLKAAIAEVTERSPGSFLMTHDVSVEIEGVCTKLMSYLKEGEPQIGLTIRAVFNTQVPTHTILDLAWIPA